MLTCVKASLPVSVTDFHFLIPSLIDHVLLVWVGFFHGLRIHIGQFEVCFESGMLLIPLQAIIK